MAVGNKRMRMRGPKTVWMLGEHDGADGTYRLKNNADTTPGVVAGTLSKTHSPSF